MQGEKPIATKKQKKAYIEMSRLLDQIIDDKLQPLLPRPSKEPTLYRYRGGSSQMSAYSKGDQIVRLIPAGNGTQDLEVAFNTRAGQTYNVVSIDQEIVNGSVIITDNATLVPNIIGTNGPVYQYIRGIPSGLDLSNFAVEWIGGYVPMEILA